MSNARKVPANPTPPGTGRFAVTRHRAGLLRSSEEAGTPLVATGEDGSPPWLRRAGGVSWRFLVTLAAVGIVVYGLLQVKYVLIAVFVALVFTSVLEPLVTWMSRVMPRALATALSLVLSVLVVAGLLTYVIYSVASQANSLAGQFNRGVTQIMDWLEHGPLPFTITSEDISGWINDGLHWLQSHAGDIAGTVASNAGSVFEIFTTIALAIFTTVFFVASGRKMWIWFLNQLPARSRARTHEAAGAGWYSFSGYARGTVIIALIDGILAYILLAIVGVPLAAPLAVLVFIGAFIPLVGAPAAMIIAAVVALAANGPIAAIIVTLGIAGIGQIEGHLLQPLIMGRQVSLHPVVVAIGVLAGTFLGGLFGAVVAIPVISVTWTVYSRLHVNDPPMTSEPPSVKELVAPALAEAEEDTESPEQAAAIAADKKRRKRRPLI